MDRIGTKHTNEVKHLLFSNPNKIFSLLFFACLGMTSVALFFEYFLLLQPCLLCYLQRFCVYFLGLISIIALVHSKKTVLIFRTYLSIALLSILAGISFSARQIYLQSLPKELIPNCAPNLSYLLDTLPFVDVLFMAIKGDGNCAEVLWSFFGISIPGWLLITFVIILFYLLWALIHSLDIHSPIKDR